MGAPIPSYQAVDFLRRAEEREGLPEDARQEIHRRVIEEAAPITALNRKYREVVFPLADDEKRERDTQSVRTAAKRLAELLEHNPRVPVRLAAEVRAALDKLLEALSDAAEAA